MPLREHPDPSPGPGEVVVAVRAAGICGSDVHGFLGATGRRRVGVVMGHEAAGDVVEVGPGVTSVRAGDRVILRSILACGRCDRCRHGQPNLCLDRQGMGMHFDGAYAERIVVPESLVAADARHAELRGGRARRAAGGRDARREHHAVRADGLRRGRRGRADRAADAACRPPRGAGLDRHHRSRAPTGSRRPRRSAPT